MRSASLVNVALQLTAIGDCCWLRVQDKVENYPKPPVSRRILGGTSRYAGTDSAPRLLAFTFKDYESWWQGGKKGTSTVDPKTGLVSFISAAGINIFTRYDFQYFDGNKWWYGAYDQTGCFRTDDLQDMLDRKVYKGCKGYNPSNAGNTFDCEEDDDKASGRGKFRWITVYCVMCQGDNPQKP